MMLRYLLVLAAFMTASCERAAGQNRVVIDTQTHYQTIDGWELTTRVWEMDKANNRYSGDWLNRRDEIIDGLVNEMGYNRIRMEIRSGAENPVDYWSQFIAGEITYLDLKSHFYEKINDNDDPHVVNDAGFQWSNLDYFVENLLLPMRAALEARGERLYVVLNYVDFKRPPLQSNVSHSQDSEEYAELIETAFKHLRTKYGVTPDALEIILEPDNTLDWNGARIAKGLLATAKRLDAMGVHPDYIAPSTAHAARAPKYFDDFAKNKAALSRLSVLSYHRYDWKDASTALPQIVKRAERNNLQTAMLEFDPGKVQHLFEDLTAGQAVAWQKYGAPYAPTTRPAKLKMVGGVAQLAEVFRNVRRGAVRLGTTTSDKSVRAMAFRNADGNHVIFLYKEGVGEVTVEGAPAGEYYVTLTNQRNSANLGPLTIGKDGKADVSFRAPGLIMLREKSR